MGLQDYRTTGLRDDRTTGLRDYGTAGKGEIGKAESRNREAEDGAEGQLFFAQPFLAGNPCLPQQPAEESRPDFSCVLVGNNQRQAPALHLGMFAARKRAFKAELVQSLDELVARNRR